VDCRTKTCKKEVNPIGLVFLEKKKRGREKGTHKKRLGRGGERDDKRIISGNYRSLNRKEVGFLRKPSRCNEKKHRPEEVLYSRC